MQSKFLFISKDKDAAATKTELEAQYTSLRIDLVEDFRDGLNLYLSNRYHLVAISLDMYETESSQYISSFCQYGSAEVLVVTEHRCEDSLKNALTYGARIAFPKQFAYDLKYRYFESAYLSQYRPLQKPLGQQPFLVDGYLEIRSKTG